MYVSVLISSGVLSFTVTITIAVVAKIFNIMVVIINIVLARIFAIRNGRVGAIGSRSRSSFTRGGGKWKEWTLCLHWFNGLWCRKYLR